MEAKGPKQENVNIRVQSAPELADGMTCFSNRCRCLAIVAQQKMALVLKQSCIILAILWHTPAAETDRGCCR